MMAEKERVKLTPDEIRTMSMFTAQYQAAQTQAQLVEQMNTQYQNILRAKYALDDTWVCLDIMDGFVKQGASDDKDN